MDNLNEEICCPKFDPEPWDNKVLDWKDKVFLKEKVKTFFFMPLNFGSVMKRLDGKIKAAVAVTPAYMCLSDHTSKWNMDIYVEVDKEVPGAECVKLSGKFLSKVYEGPFRDTAKWCKDYENYVKEKNFNIKKWYMWYTTCPKCAKEYGKNYVTILCEIE